MIDADLPDRLANTGAAVHRAPDSTVPDGHPPDWLVEPDSLDGLVAAVGLLNAAGVRWRVDALGRNWGYDDGRVPEPGVIVRLARLDRLDLDPELGLATVQPGVTFARLRAALDEAQAPFRLPAPGSGPHTSVLGNALDRGLLSGLGEREQHCRDFLVMARDGTLTRLDWPGREADRVRRAVPYPPGPHRRGSVFQTGGHGPVVVELTHVLPVAVPYTAPLVLLAGPEPTEALLRCWRELLRQRLVDGSLLQPPVRRRIQGLVTAHDGLVLHLGVGAGSRPMLGATVSEVRRIAAQHGLRAALDAAGPADDLRILGASGDQPDAVARGPVGLEWHTACLPFDPALVVAYWRAQQAEPALADTPWTLRPLDSRALVWLAPLTYRKDDPASRAELRRRGAAFARVREAFGLPSYRRGGLRTPR
ncbi:FAD-binding protein [Micromonospora sp. NPDC047074]|uniref:FAD-binding protein n=1 Tax=Micromonospora sp. NPDC047074 TaxID=3154339 RepID=UPI0033C5C807